jgi:predicted RNase H-like HicB family nuclease
MIYRHTILMERGTSEDVWVATVPALTGCVTHGASIEEALAQAQEAVAGHVEALLKFGEAMPTESESSIVATVVVDIDPVTATAFVGAAD